MTKEFLGIMIRIMQENDQKNLINIQIRKLDDYGILVNARTNGDIEALADAMRALKKEEFPGLVHKLFVINCSTI